MKRLIAAALLALTSVAFSATLSPIQLLNPAGSTSGQVITSTGPTTAPAWTTVTLSGLGGLAAANNLSDLTSAGTARTNLGLGTAATQNTGTSGATVPLLSTANTWTLQQAFTVRPTFNSATPWDSANLSFATPPAIGATTPAAGAFTTLSASSTVSGTGFSSYLAAPPVIGTTPNAGGFTSLSATGAFTPSQTFGIVGTTTNNNANAGSVGEFVSSTVLVGSAVTLTTGTTANVTSISLTAGDWDISGNVWTNPAGATIQTLADAGISTTSASFPSSPGNGASTQLPYTAATGAAIGIPTGKMRLSLSATTTVFLVANVNFSAGTNAAYGFIGARRVR